MVTRQAKQEHPAHQQQQQQQTLKRENRDEEKKAVADDGGNYTREEDCSKNVGDKSNKSGIVDGEWRVSELSGNNLKIVSRRQERNKEETLFRDGKIGNGSNGDSTQCSDIEDDDDDDDDLEIDQKLAEEEEEEGRYVVDEIETDEEDKDTGKHVESADRWIKKKVVTRVEREASFGTNNRDQSELVPHLDDTTFGEVSITNSRHVHVGNTNYYKGPVTIKQFVYTNAYPILDDTDGSSSARVSDSNPNDAHNVKNNSNGPIFTSHRDYDRVTKWLWTWRCAAILSVLALSLITVVTVASVLLTSKGDGLPNKVPESPGSGADPDLPGDSVRIIERESWNAQPPAKELLKLRETPTPHVIISHTATASCETQSSCVLKVRLIQTFHIESFGWDDIGYNFLVGGDGLAYVGRGWDFAGSHAFGYNFNSIGISFIGTFNDVAPSKVQIQAAQRLIQLGVNMSKISTTYKLLGHRQVSATLSPGDKLYKILQTWSHWSSYPPPQPNRTNATNFLHSATLLPLFLIIASDFLLLCRVVVKKIIDAFIAGVSNIYEYNCFIILVCFNNNDSIYR